VSKEEKGDSMKSIPFNMPPYIGKELDYIKECVENHKICGDGEFTAKCSRWLEDKTKSKKCLLTTSCTHALEMAVILSGIRQGDEVILPAFTFSSTADCIVMRGGVPVFIDIRPDTMNMDENLIEDAITPRTKAIIVVHYAGVACEMDSIMKIAAAHQLVVIEDAAQGLMSSYKGSALGSIGDYGCFSFHETKNYSMGEGGALLLKNEADIERAEIIREKGTNRSKFHRGQVDKYTWVDFGSSYLPSELNAAYLFAQLEGADRINRVRCGHFAHYWERLSPLMEKGLVTLPVIPDGIEANGHMFYLKTKDLEERTKLIDFLKNEGIMSVFHYIPLHTAPAGLKYGRFHGEDRFTTKESNRLTRLPMYYQLEDGEVDYICDKIMEFYGVS
jgi:dTDP-4-amino-4,6-dideoxygalactose transaminase